MVANTASLAWVHKPRLASLSEQLNDRRTISYWQQYQQYQKYQKTGWDRLALISLPFPVQQQEPSFLFFSILLYPEERGPYTHTQGGVHVYINYGSAISLQPSHSRFTSQVHRCMHISIYQNTNFGIKAEANTRTSQSQHKDLSI